MCPEDLALMGRSFFTVPQVVNCSLLTMKKAHLILSQRDIIDDAAILISSRIDKVREEISELNHCGDNVLTAEA